MAAVAAMWCESLCPRQHLHSECPQHGHMQHVHPHDAAAAHHHSAGHHCGQHPPDGSSSSCNKYCRSVDCGGCKGCKISCPVCLFMISALLLLSPMASSVAAASPQCGGHGAMLSASSTTCACEPGYGPSASDPGMCIPDSGAPGSWAVKFAHGGDSPEEHMWELMEKSAAESLSGTDALRLMDKISGVYIDEHEAEVHEHDHDEHDEEDPGHEGHEHNEHDHDHEEHEEHEEGHEEHEEDHEEHEHEHDEHEHEEHGHEEHEEGHEEHEHEQDHEEHEDGTEHEGDEHDGEHHAHEEETAAECSGHGHLHGSECHCDEGWMMNSTNSMACVPQYVGRRMLAEQMCGGHGHVHGGGCHCEDGYFRDPSDNLNCLPSTTASLTTDTLWTLSAADLIAAVGLNGVLYMENLTSALPLIVSCQMDSSCTLEVSQPDPHAGHNAGGEVEVWMAAVATVLFFVLPVMAIFVPFVVARFVNGHTYTVLFSIGNCFSAGLIFTLGIMHIIPHTMESQWEVGAEYPLNFLLITVGFFVTLFLEQIPSIHTNGSPLGGFDSATQAIRSSQSGSTGGGHAIPIKSVDACCAGDHAHVDPPVEGMPAAVASTGDVSMSVTTPNPTSSSVLQRVNVLIPAFIFFIARQFHACLEAFFVGVTSNADDFWIFVGAVSVHKFFIAMSFGMKVHALWGSSDLLQRWALAVLCALWAALSAICVFVGYVIASSISPMAQLVLTSLAAGTFLYIGSFEILSEEFVHSHGAAPCGSQQQSASDKVSERQNWGTKPAHGYFKFLTIAVGVVLVALTSLIPHTH